MVDNYTTEWNNSAGYDFGDPTSYGFHDGKDINDNRAGDSDLGKSLYAIADGKITGIHQHTTKPTFGKHFFLEINGSYGIRYVHYAHCQDLFIIEGQEVKEGNRIATVGKSGTDYAHCHFAIKKKANGMDTIAKTKAELDDAWEDPIKFIEANMEPMVTIPQKELDAIRLRRDELFNENAALKETINNLNTQIQSHQGQITTSQNEISNLKAQLLNETTAKETLQQQVNQLSPVQAEFNQLKQNYDSDKIKWWEQFEINNRTIAQLENSSYKTLGKLQLLKILLAKVFNLT